MTDNLPTESKFFLYQTEDGKTRIEIRLENETVWMSQKLIGQLYQKDIRTINEHLKNIYKEEELSPESTIRKFRIVQKEGKRDVSREVDFYNLEAIISVGYRVHSPRGTQFRKWATERLGEYLIFINLLLTMTPERKRQCHFLKLFRINSILPSPGKLLLN